MPKPKGLASDSTALHELVSVMTADVFHQLPLAMGMYTIHAMPQLYLITSNSHTHAVLSTMLPCEIAIPLSTMLL